MPVKLDPVLTVLFELEIILTTLQNLQTHKAMFLESIE